MKKFWKKVLASSLAFICTVTAGVAAIATNGFGLFNAAQVEGVEHNKQLSFGNFFGNGIMLTASAEEANTGTPIFDSVVEDCGNIATANSVNKTSAPFTYKDFSLYNNKYVTRVGVPVKTVVDYTADSIFTLYVVSYNSPLTAFTQVSEHKLIIPANTFTSNTVNTWYYFDTSIYIGDNQTLAFAASDDTVAWGYLGEAVGSKYNFYNRLFGTYTSQTYRIFFDVYTSDSSTPSTPATDSVRLTATVTPATATNKVSWSVAWKNASSTWANGKTVTDYVTVTPTADGALTADVECKQAFGEQIIVTAILLDNFNFSAQCTLDYLKRVQNLSGNVTSAGMISPTTMVNIPYEETYEFNKSIVKPYIAYPALLVKSYENIFNGTYTWSVGTIQESATESYTLEMSDGLRTALKAQGLNTTFTSMEIKADESILCTEEFYKVVVLGISAVDAMPDSFLNAINNNADDYDFAICYNVSTSRETKIASCKVKLNGVQTTGFALSHTSIIF